MSKNLKLEKLILDWLQKGRHEASKKAIASQSELDWALYNLYHDLIGELLSCQFEALSEEGKRRVAQMFEDSLDGS